LDNKLQSCQRKRKEKGEVSGFEATEATSGSLDVIGKHYKQIDMTRIAWVFEKKNGTRYEIVID
jgi:hypothetical protein